MNELNVRVRVKYGYRTLTKAILGAGWLLGYVAPEAAIAFTLRALSFVPMEHLAGSEWKEDRR